MADKTLVSQPFPQHGFPLVDPESGVITRPWFEFLVGLWRRTNRSQPQILDANSSPYDFEPGSSGTLFITGGSGREIQYWHDGTYYDIGDQTVVPIVVTDKLRITFTTLPTLFFVPQ